MIAKLIQALRLTRPTPFWWRIWNATLMAAVAAALFYIPAYGWAYFWREVFTLTIIWLQLLLVLSFLAHPLRELRAILERLPDYVRRLRGWTSDEKLLHFVLFGALISALALSVLMVYLVWGWATQVAAWLFGSAGALETLTIAVLMAAVPVKIGTAYYLRLYSAVAWKLAPRMKLGLMLQKIRYECEQAAVPNDVIADAIFAVRLLPVQLVTNPVEQGDEFVSILLEEDLDFAEAFSRFYFTSNRAQSGGTKL